MVDRCIRIDCFQTTASYKKPMSIGVGETYRLPPYSTVIGFVHNMCGFVEYHPMKVSVQGEYTTVIIDKYTRYCMGIAYDETRHQLKVLNADGKFDGITRGLGANELLVDVRLVLHVLPEEKDFDIVYDGLKNPVIYPALGRYEDLLRIDDVREVEIVPTERPNAFFDAYVPEYMHASIGKCSRYSLNKVYSYSDEKKKTREWEKVSAYHVSKNTNIMRCAGAFEEKVSKTGVFFA